MSDSGGGPRPMAWWDDLIADVRARAADYEDDGWETVVLHPGDVTALDGRYGGRVGLSVLVPDDEFDALERVFEAESVDSCDVYRTEVEGYVAFVLAVETTDRTAILCPGYYSLADDSAHAMFDQATTAGSLRVYVRRLDESRVEVTLGDPDLLAPSEA